MGGSGDNFHQDYREETFKAPPEKSTGRVFAVVAALVGIYNYDSAPLLLTGLGFSVLFAALAQFAPEWLGPLNRLWFRFSLILHKIMNPLIMGLMFLVVIIPTGLLMRIWRDPLQKKPDPLAKTYWVTRPSSPDDSGAKSRSMRNQF